MEDKYKIQPVEETRATIFDSTLDLSMDISEICIDMLLKEGVVKDIPILGAVYKVGKIGYSAERLIFIKKVLMFAQEMQRNDVGKGILKKHKKLMSSNPKKYYKELEIIIEYISRQVGCEKSVLNGRIYYLYLNEQIDYEDFILLLETIDQIHLSDLDTLKDIYRKGTLLEEDLFNEIACVRLHNCGLITYFNGMSASIGDEKAIIATINWLGKFFCEEVLCIKNI